MRAAGQRHVEQDALLAHAVHWVPFHFVELGLSSQVLKDPVLEKSAGLAVDLGAVRALPLLVSLLAVGVCQAVLVLLDESQVEFALLSSPNEVSWGLLLLSEGPISIFNHRTALLVDLGFRSHSFLEFAISFLTELLFLLQRSPVDGVKAVALRLRLGWRELSGNDPEVHGRGLDAAASTGQRS